MALFHRKSVATYDIEMCPAYGDLAQGNTDPIDIRSGLNPSMGAFQFRVPPAPTFGDAELDSLSLQLYTSNLTFGTAAKTYPVLLGYKLRDHFNLDDQAGVATEGSVVKSLDIPAVYCAIQTSQGHFWKEDFTLAGTEEDIVLRGDVHFIVNQPYILRADAGSASSETIAGDAGELLSGYHIAGAIFGNPKGLDDFTTTTADGTSIILLKDSKSKPGYMRPTGDTSSNWDMSSLHRAFTVPYWDKERMISAGLLKYRSVSEANKPLDAEGFYSEPLFTPGKTLVSIAKTTLNPVLLDDFSSAVQGLNTADPTATTARVAADKTALWRGGITISDAVEGSSGKGIRMRNYWANTVGSDTTDIINKKYQDVMFCIPNIPAPIPRDVAGHDEAANKWESMGTQKIEMDVNLTLPTHYAEVGALDDDLSSFVDATCDFVHDAGSPRVVAHDANALIASLSVGSTVSGTGIAVGSTIASIDTATQFTLSADTTATGTNVSLTFDGRGLGEAAQFITSDRAFIICFSNEMPTLEQSFYDYFKAVTDNNANFVGFALTNYDSDEDGLLTSQSRFGISPSAHANKNAKTYNKNTWAIGTKTLFNKAWNNDRVAGVAAGTQHPTVVFGDNAFAYISSSKIDGVSTHTRNGDSFKIQLTYHPTKSGMSMKLLNTDGSTLDNKDSIMVECQSDNYLKEGVQELSKGTNMDNWTPHMTVWLTNWPYNKTTTTTASCDSEITALDANDASHAAESICRISNIIFKRQNWDITNCTQSEHSFHRGSTLAIPSPEGIHSFVPYNGAVDDTGNFYSAATAADFSPNPPTRTGVTVLSFGYDNATDIADAAKYMLLNNFTASNYSNLYPLDNTLAAYTTPDDRTLPVMAGYSSNIENLGYQAQRAVFETGAGAHTTRGLTVGDSTKQVQTTGTNCIEHFTQKGLIIWNFDPDTDDTGGGTDVAYTPRENIWASTKILEVVSENPLVIRVQNPHILQLDANNHDWDSKNQKRFRIFLAGSTLATAADYADVEVVSINGDEITCGGSGQRILLKLQQEIWRAWISPLKYWVYLHIKNNTILHESPYIGQEDAASGRNYTTACMVSSTTLAGATYNESAFVDGPYTNKWDLKPFSMGSAIHHQDYGFGDFDKETTAGGHCMEMVPRLNNYTISKMRGLAESGVVPNQDVTLFVTLQQALIGENISIEVDSSEDAVVAKKPTLIANFVDPLPTIEEFGITPDEDNPQFPKITWSCSDKDSWYGMLFISDSQVSSQYHSCVAHIPLNEDIDGVVSSGTTYLYRPNIGESYHDNTSSQTGTVAGTVNSEITGLAGYTKNFVLRSSDASLSFTASAVTPPNTQMTASVHATPDYYSGTDAGYILYQSARFYIYVEDTASPYIQAKITTNDAENYYLKSNVIYADGETPIHIALTANTLLKTGNFKLFINGELEDTTDCVVGTTIAESVSPIIVGNDPGGDAFGGKIEEVCIYDEAVHFVKPQTGEFILTEPLFGGEQNLIATDGSSKNYSVRLFVKDFHNIRGYTSAEVASTGQLSISKPSFNLNET